MSTAFLCWACADVHEAPCPHEDGSLDLRTDDYFALFGLPRALLLDTEDLRERFYERSRRLHPDRFAQRGGDVLAAATRGSAALNQGYRTLRDPLTRVAHRIQLLGSPPSEQAPSPALLMELMETEEQLDEVRGASPSPAQRANLEATQAAYRARVAELDAELERLSAEHDRLAICADSPGPLDPHPALASIVTALQANLGVRKYYRNILRNLNEVLDP